MNSMEEIKVPTMYTYVLEDGDLGDHIFSGLHMALLFLPHGQVIKMLYDHWMYHLLEGILLRRAMAGSYQLSDGICSMLFDYVSPGEWNPAGWEVEGSPTRTQEQWTGSWGVNSMTLEEHAHFSVLGRSRYEKHRTRNLTRRAADELNHQGLKSGFRIYERSFSVRASTHPATTSISGKSLLILTDPKPFSNEKVLHLDCFEFRDKMLLQELIYRLESRCVFLGIPVHSANHIHTDMHLLDQLYQKKSTIVLNGSINEAEVEAEFKFYRERPFSDDVDTGTESRIYTRVRNWFQS